MSEPQNISSILAALSEYRELTGVLNLANSTSGSSSGAPGQPQQAPPSSNYPSTYPPDRGSTTGSYSLPQPVGSGSVDLSNIKPVSSGSVSIADAIQKARGFAAERGVAYDANRGEHVD